MADYNIYNKREVYTCGLTHESYESFYNCHCAELARYANLCFYLGTVSLIVAAAVTMYTRFDITYDNRAAAILYVSTAGLALVIIMVMTRIFPGRTRTHRPEGETTDQSLGYIKKDLSDLTSPFGEQDQFYDKAQKKAQDAEVQAAERRRQQSPSATRRASAAPSPTLRRQFSFHSRRPTEALNRLAPPDYPQTAAEIGRSQSDARRIFMDVDPLKRPSSSLYHHMSVSSDELRENDGQDTFEIPTPARLQQHDPHAMSVEDALIYNFPPLERTVGVELDSAHNSESAPPVEITVAQSESESPASAADSQGDPDSHRDAPTPSRRKSPRTALTSV